MSICEEENIPEAVKAANGCGGATDTLTTNIQAILNGIIGAAGFVAVIFIIIGGINYMTSGGDTAKLKKAKDTILYATIGLVICTLSFAIVNWVINAIPGSTSTEAQAEGTAIVVSENSIAFLQK